MYRVATVCLGNICRSPMAQNMLRDALREAGVLHHVEVLSYGTSDWEEGNPADPRAQKLMRERGYGTEEEISGHRATPITLELLEDLNLALAMDVDHLQYLDELVRQLPEDRFNTPQVRMFGSFNPRLEHASPAEQGIYDPWFGQEEDFKKVAALIEEALPNLVEHIKRESMSRAILNVEELSPEALAHDFEDGPAEGASPGEAAGAGDADTRG